MANTPTILRMKAASARSNRHALGFTLTEILMALGIFAIGMAAVSSLFPVSAILQRETASDIHSNHVASNVEAVVKAFPFTYDNTFTASPTGNLNGFYHANTNSTERNVKSLVLDSSIPENRGPFPTAQRAYPSAQLSGNFLDDVSNCDFFWVPFIQDLNGDPLNPNWVARVFILEGDSGVDYSTITGAANDSDTNPRFPKVVSTGLSIGAGFFQVDAAVAEQLDGGDLVMDNNGNVYTIRQITGNVLVVNSAIPTHPAPPTTLWYAPSLGSTSGSPTRDIITITLSPGPVRN